MSPDLPPEILRAAVAHLAPVVPLLTDPERPIQLVIAGKSHPADETGKQLIQHV